MPIAPSKLQAELYLKLKSWVPTWFFHDTYFQNALLQAIAETFEQTDLNIAEHEDQTYICRAEGLYIEEHAFERGLERTTGESDLSLQTRTKNIVNQNNCAAIKAIVDSLLAVGVSKIIEERDFIYFNRDAFFNRGDIFATKQYNYFYIVIPEQVEPSREDFLSRDCFFDRDCFYSSVPRVDRTDVYDAITAQVNKIKACGVLYFVVVI